MMITISQNSLTCKMAEYYHQKKPETGCELATGVVGFVFACILAVAVAYMGSMAVASLALFGNLDAPVNVGLIYMLPYQGALLAIAAVLFGAGAWFCRQVKIA